MPTTVDLKRELSGLYSAASTPALVEVPDLPYLMISGHGDPESDPRYAQSVQALYSVAYTLRFALKRGPEAIDAPVMPLEGLWWMPDMSAFATAPRSDWDWTMMIVQPEQVTTELVSDARATARRKKGLAAIDRVDLARYDEGLSAQVTYRGPYDQEGPTIAGLHRFIAEQHCALRGKHHEIYLGDPRRAAPEKLRTIIRQPVTRL